MKTMNSTYIDFSVAIEKYFGQYLVAERGASSHTIRSYRDNFLIFIHYFEEVLKIPVEKIKLDIMDRTLVCSYLNWLESDNNNSIRTRNQRLAVLRSFFKYLMYLDPTHMAQWKVICEIKFKKGSSSLMNYLTIEGMRLLLEQIDTKSRKGRRDLALLSLLYNSAARVQELIDLKPCVVRLSKPYGLELTGKGKKTRLVPLEESTAKLIERYMQEYGLDKIENSTHPLFFNERGQKLSPSGVNFIINKYADKAREVSAELIPKKISPHCFRHSKSMHLLQAGCPLIYIRDFLGHVSVETTEIYARTDSAHKRKALEDAYEKVGIKNPEMGIWEKDPKLIAFLKSLS